MSRLSNFLTRYSGVIGLGGALIGGVYQVNQQRTNSEGGLVADAALQAETGAKSLSEVKGLTTIAGVLNASGLAADKGSNGEITPLSTPNNPAMAKSGQAIS